MLEVLDAGTYTYLRLATSEGEKWAAVPVTDLQVGDEAHLEGAMVMTDFESPSLGRSFDSILFGTLAAEVSNGQEPAPAVTPTGEHLGDRSVLEVNEQRATLAGSSVTVEGTVTRFTPAVMGKNWLHVSDGTGSSDAGTDDLTVTTAANLEIGDTVRLSGLVSTDVDLGMGYQYAVLLEDAEVEGTRE